MTPALCYPPFTVVWRVTEHCDLACPFCAYSWEVRRPRAQADLKTALALGEKLRDHARATGRAVHVSFLGGEPLLWPHLPEVSRQFHEWGLSLGLTTNGTRLPRSDLLDVLSTFYSLLTFSVDALGPRHDELRGRRGLSEQIQAAVSELRARRQTEGRPRLRANVVLMRSTIFEFEPLCAALAEWGVDEVTFNALGGFDRPGAFFDGERLLPEQLAWLRAALPGIRARLAPLVVHGSARYLERLSDAAANLESPISDCSPGQSFLFVTESGLVAPCSFTPHGYGLPLAQVSALAELPRLFSERQRTQHDQACDNCRSTQVFGKFLIDDF